MTLSRVAVTTLTNMRTKVRREAKDPATLPSGATRKTAQLRYSNDDVDDAINDALIQQGTEMSGRNPGLYLLYSDLSYSGHSVNLPSAIGGADRIHKVECIANEDYPVAAEYVSPHELEEHTESNSPYVYTFLGKALDGTETSGAPKYMIAIRPRNTQTFRIWYVAPPVIYGAATDTHEFTGVWRELVALRAAKILMSRDQEFTTQQQERLDVQEALFAAFSPIQQSHQRIRRARIGRS